MTIQEIKNRIRGLSLKEQSEIEQFAHDCCAKEKANAWDRVLLAIQDYEDVYGDIIFQAPDGTPLVIKTYYEYSGKFPLIIQEREMDR